MLTQVHRILDEATARSLNSVAAFMPGVLALLMILLTAILVATLARVIVLRALRGLEFDRYASRWGLSDWSQSRSLSVVVAYATQWTILLLGLLTGLTALDAAMPSRFAMSVFRYVPHAVAAIIVLVVGTVLAQFVSRALLISAVNMQIQSARALALLVRWVVLIVAASMALEQLGIGRQILLLAFAIFFGGLVLAVAVAVGLGAKDVVARALERQFSERPDRAGHPIDHV